MRGLFAIYKRETALIFRSPIAYAIAFALMFIVGLFLSGTFTSIVQQAFFAAQQGGQPPQVNATTLIVRNIGIFSSLIFLIAPLLTMRLLSEESREGTMEVLMTLPMSDWAIVTGKFLAVWTFYTVLVLLTLLHAVMLRGFGPVNVSLAFSAYVGVWLYGGAALALSMIWSALTEDQIVAAFLGVATLLIFSILDSLAIIVTTDFGGLADLMRTLGFAPHFQNTMLAGIWRAEDVLYFALLIVISLFITTLIVSSRRWRA